MELLPEEALEAEALTEALSLPRPLRDWEGEALKQALLQALLLAQALAELQAQWLPEELALLLPVELEDWDRLLVWDREVVKEEEAQLLPDLLGL